MSVKCARKGCPIDEFRVGGYCSAQCGALAEVEEERDDAVAEAADLRAQLQLVAKERDFWTVKWTMALRRVAEAERPLNLALSTGLAECETLRFERDQMIEAWEAVVADQDETRMELEDTIVLLKRELTKRGVCLCQTALEDPGPRHIPTCPNSDPNYVPPGFLQPPSWRPEGT